jgi:hypothetical protein
MNPRSKAIWLLRAMWGTVGLTAFLWIGYEDQGLSMAILMASLITASTWASYMLRGGIPSSTSKPARVLKLAWTGLLGGAATAVVGALLMLIKVSIHRHAAPDFSGGDVLWVLRQVPGWGLAGALAGAVLGLLWPAHKG